MFIQLTDYPDAMTCLKGSIETTFSALTRLFGEPLEGDDYKVSGEWIFKGPNGSVFTVYDWKSTALYDTDLPSVADFRATSKPSTFNIGGDKPAFEFIVWLDSKLRGAA